MPTLHSRTTGSSDDHAGDNSQHNPSTTRSHASSTPQDVEGAIEANFWTDENLARWTGPEASKQIPGINSQTAAGVCDAHKKLLGRFVRNHCECLIDKQHMYPNIASVVGQEWASKVGNQHWASTPQKLLESGKVMKGWPSIHNLGWPGSASALRSMEDVKGLLVWFFTAKHRENLKLCDLESEGMSLLYLFIMNSPNDIPILYYIISRIS